MNGHLRFRARAADRRGLGRFQWEVGGIHRGKFVSRAGRARLCRAATPHGSTESRPTISEIVVTKLEIVLMAFFRERAAEMRTRMGKILRRAKEQPAESQPGSRKHRAEFSEAPAAD